MIRLGLIGDNIMASRAPLLHRLCGEMCGLSVSYDLLIPRTQGLAFDALFERCRDEGYHGLNITLPYKIRVVPKLVIENSRMRAIGSVNTVVFQRGKALGHNTDYTGFIAAYRHGFGAHAAGRVAVIGAGGAGKAVAFGLLDLGATALTLFDQKPEMAETLALDLHSSDSTCEVRCAASAAEALEVCDGVVNCTPLGMDGYPGTAVSSELLAGKSWAFDAVYTPMITQFLQDARRAGLAILGGYELHFHQGIQAFECFTGYLPQDLTKLRARHLAGG